MIDLHLQEDFDRVVFFIEGGRVKEVPLRNLCMEFSEKVRTPDGEKPIFFVDGCRLLCRVDPDFKMTFDSELLAENALLQIYKDDLIDGWFAPDFFFSKEDAERHKTL